MDGYHARRPDRLKETRELAADAGALLTVAVMDLTLADMGLFMLDRDLCMTAANSCVEAGRRFGLASLPVALLWLAGAHALDGREKEMEATLAESLELSPGDPRILGDAWGRVRATFALLHEDRARLKTALDTSMPFVRAAPTTTSVFPGRMLWALLHTLEDEEEGVSERAEVAAAEHVLHLPLHRATLALAEAVALGRRGRGDEATAIVESNIGSLANSGMAQYALRLTAEAALRDGWGDPAPWLRQSEAFFSGRGYERVASRCRALLRDAGAPARRRGRGESEVPARLRAMGVTSREHDVLQLVAEGLSTREIASRLFLSPRTVEHHLASLFARAGVHDRDQLVTTLVTQTDQTG
jgi:DNA-binding CsgD family transcriptional regulator